MAKMFEHGEVDSRWVIDRSQWTETTCDNCGGVILASERRHVVEIPGDPEADFDEYAEIWCDECREIG